MPLRLTKEEVVTTRVLAKNGQNHSQIARTVGASEGTHQVLVQLEDVDRPPVVLALLLPGGEHDNTRPSRPRSLLRGQPLPESPMYD